MYKIKEEDTILIDVYGFNRQSNEVRAGEKKKGQMTRVITSVGTKDRGLFFFFFYYYYIL